MHKQVQLRVLDVQVPFVQLVQGPTECISEQYLYLLGFQLDVGLDESFTALFEYTVHACEFIAQHLLYSWNSVGPINHAVVQCLEQIELSLFSDRLEHIACSLKQILRVRADLNLAELLQFGHSVPEEAAEHLEQAQTHRHVIDE